MQARTRRGVIDPGVSARLHSRKHSYPHDAPDVCKEFPGCCANSNGERRNKPGNLNSGSETKALGLPDEQP